MATITPILRKQKRDQRGRCPIWLRISDRDQTRFVSLGEKVLPSRWNKGKGRVRKGHPHATLLNRLIEKKVEEAREEVLRLKLDDTYATAEHLKEMLQPDQQAGDFLAFWQRHLEALQQKGNVGRYRRLRATCKKVEAFARQKRLLPLTFDRLTVRFLNEFETHCIADLKNKQSTVATNLSDIRSLVNKAVDEGRLELSSSPFVRFTIEQGEAPERTKLSFEEVRSLEALDLEEKSLLALTRDVFLFAFYAAGVRFADVAWMTTGRIVAGDDREPDRLTYRMGKTGRHHAVKITPPARKILERYLTKKSGNAFVFPLFEGYDLSTPERYRAKASQNALCNKYLKQLAEQAGIDKPLSMHVARHSFADAARTAGWSIYDIQKALGHHSVAMTERYLKAFDQEALDGKMDELFGTDRGISR